MRFKNEEFPTLLGKELNELVLITIKPGGTRDADVSLSLLGKIESMR